MTTSSEPGLQPAVDKTGGRGALPDRTDVKTPEALRQREDEKEQAYLAFLLWVMQSPNQRSNRLIARALSTAESNVRHWRKRYQWPLRKAAVHNAEYICLSLWRDRMHEQPGPVQQARLRVALDLVLEQSGYSSLWRDVQRQRTSKSSRLDEKVDEKPNNYAAPLTQTELEQIDPGRHMRDLSAQVMRDHLRTEDIRRQVLLIDAVLGLIAKKVQTGDLDVKVSDIPSLLKARAMITGLPSEQTPQQVVPQQVHQHLHLVESARMQEARKTNDGGTILQAMQQEVQELSVILSAVPDPVPGS